MVKVTRTFDVSDVQRVEITLGNGDISLKAGGDTVSLRAKVHSDDEQDLEITLDGGRLWIGHRGISQSGTMSGSMRSYQPIDIELSLPEAAGIPVVAQTGNGDISAGNVRQVTRLKTGKGDVAAAHTSGSLTIESGKGDVAVSDIGGALEINTGAGDVAVNEVRGGLKVHTGRGDVAIKSITGALDVKTGSGDVVVNNWAQGRSGNGAADTSSIHSGSGDVVIKNAQAAALSLRTGRGDCIAARCDIADLEMRTGSGDLKLDGDPGGGRWQVNTGKGDISLALPGNAGVRVQAVTRHGTVSTALPRVNVGRPGPASAHSDRSIMVLGDEPRAEVELETGKGDISVRTYGPARATKAVEQPVYTAEIVEAGSGTPQLPPTQPAIVPATRPNGAATMAVLESLSKGEISVSEAEMLLKAIG